MPEQSERDALRERIAAVAAAHHENATLYRDREILRGCTCGAEVRDFQEHLADAVLAVLPQSQEYEQVGWRILNAASGFAGSNLYENEVPRPRNPALTTEDLYRRVPEGSSSSSSVAESSSPEAPIGTPPPDRADRMLANIDRLKGLVVRVEQGDEGETVLAVDASPLMGEDDLGPEEWWLFPEDDHQWSHGPSGVTASLGESLWGIACCYEPPEASSSSPVTGESTNG